MELTAEASINMEQRFEDLEKTNEFLSAEVLSLKGNISELSETKNNMATKIVSLESAVSDGNCRIQYMYIWENLCDYKQEQNNYKQEQNDRFERLERVQNYTSRHTNKVLEALHLNPVDIESASVVTHVCDFCGNATEISLHSQQLFGAPVAASGEGEDDSTPGSGDGIAEGNEGDFSSIESLVLGPVAAPPAPFTIFEDFA